jgi:hypothetical protein
MRFNKYERIYIVIFVASIVVGMINGAMNMNYYKCCEDSLNPPQGFTPLTFFSANYVLSLGEMVTAGVASLYINFHTFSITSSYLASQNLLYTMPVLLIHGGLELVGSLLLALLGFSFIERKFFKVKSKLMYDRLFVYGTALIFLASIIEYGLLKLAG